MDTKPFIELLRRVVKSRYKDFLMTGRMIMQCYTIDEDSDVGLHYILHIPNDDPYNDSFYNETLVLQPDVIMDAYKNGHDKLTEKKKKTNAKPKEIQEKMDFVITDKGAKLKMQFIVQDELIDTQTVHLLYPVKDGNAIASNVTNAYTGILDKLKVGGAALSFDGYRLGLYDMAMNSAQIVFYTVKIKGIKVKIPLYRSMFLGQKSFDEFFISVQETTIDMVYLYTIQFARKGIIEQFIGYIQTF